jgi:hypothetical protein
MSALEEAILKIEAKIHASVGLSRIRASTPKGLCPFCLDPLPPRQGRGGKGRRWTSCADSICLTAYQRLWKREKRQEGERLRAKYMARFISKTTPCPITGCVWWLGATDPEGYGKFQTWDGTKQKHWRAHRFALAAVGVEVRDDQVVMHMCDQPSCVNVAHLRPGTQKENRLDCTHKGRNARGEKNPQSVLTTEQAAAIILAPSNEKPSAIKRRLCISSLQAVQMIRAGKTWLWLRRELDKSPMRAGQFGGTR